MAKPDPAFLNPARYPFTCRIEPRFGDLDVNMHINNVAMASMMEEAHVRFHRASNYTAQLAGLSSMVASVTIEYLGQGSYSEPVEIHVAAEQIGRTSQTLVKLATQASRTIAFSRAVIVTVGPDGPAPMPAALVKSSDRWALRA
jgi:acyl-CoA thioester hydrolase